MVELLDLLINRLSLLLGSHGLTVKLFLGAIIGHIDYHFGCCGGKLLSLLLLRARGQSEVNEL